jgi:hypothetical protein
MILRTALMMVSKMATRCLCFGDRLNAAHSKKKKYINQP